MASQILVKCKILLCYNTGNNNYFTIINIINWRINKMTTRTFKQMGIAYGSQPANITAKIDNVVVYSGPVTTINEPFPELPNLEFSVSNQLFSWTANVNFSGSQVISLSVDGNVDLLLAQLSANYTPIANATGNVTGNAISSGPDGYVNFQSRQFGNTYINGELQSVTHGDLPGMWWWRIPSPSEFVENITIETGVE